MKVMVMVITIIITTTIIIINTIIKYTYIFIIDYYEQKTCYNNIDINVNVGKTMP